MAKQFLLILAAAGALQKPPTPPRPAALKAVDDPALNSLSNEPLTHSVLAHDDGAEHLGDVGGAHLDTDLSFFAKSRIAFSPAQRVALTANGNLQRVLSAYHNERVTIRVLSHEARIIRTCGGGAVVLELADRPACVARSSVVARTRTAIEERNKGGGLGQLFSELGGKQEFSSSWRWRGPRRRSRASTSFERAPRLPHRARSCPSISWPRFPGRGPRGTRTASSRRASAARVRAVRRRFVLVYIRRFGRVI